MNKRFLALIIVFALVLSCVPYGVLAEGTESTPIPEPHSHAATHICEDCQQEDVTWTAWEDSTTLPKTTGHYYLTGPVDVTGRQVVNGDNHVVLCLNGYTVSGSNKACIYSVESTTASLVISDCTAYTDDAGNLVAGQLTAGKDGNVGGALYAKEGKLSAYSIKLTDNKNTQTSTALGWSGGAAHVRGSSQVLFKGCEFSGNHTTAEGGAICVRDSAKVTVENTVFRNNKADRDGGAIYQVGSFGSVTVKDCVFEDNAGKNGGAVFTNGGACQIDNTTFTKNTASANGAVFFNGGTCGLHNVQMTDNAAASGGSAVHISAGAQVTIADGNFTENRITKAGDTFRGAVYVAGAASRFYLSGKIVIRDNAVADLYVQNNSNRTDGNHWVNLNGLTEGSEFGMTTYTAVDEDRLNSMIMTGNPENWDMDWITYTNNGMSIDYKTDTQQFVFAVKTTHRHCDCGDQAATDAGCDHTENAYVAWESQTSLPNADGFYYLTGDVTLSSHVQLKTGDLHLCLNGYSITVNGEEGTAGDRIFTLNETAQLTISDCTAKTEEGVYTAGRLTGGTNGAIMIPNISGSAVQQVVLKLYDGIITGNSGKTGAAVLVQDCALFEMHGGEISENTATGAASAVFAGTGGIVKVYGGTIQKNQAGGNGTVALSTAEFYLYGGEIIGNTAKNGGGIYTSGVSSLHLLGGQISDNTATGIGGGVWAQQGAKVHVAGDIVVKNNICGSNASNLHLGGDTLMTVDALTEAVGQIGITTETDKLPRFISTELADEKALQYFFSDSVYRVLELKDGKLYLTHSSDHKHCDCAAPDGENCEHVQNAWIPWDSTTTVPSSSGYYYLVNDVTVSSHTTVTEGDIHICLNGHTVSVEAKEGTSQDRIYTLKGSAKLTIADCTARTVDGVYTAGRITGCSSGAIMVPNETGKTETGEDIVHTVEIKLYDGIFSGNTGSTGGAVLVQDGGSLYMYGGEISDTHVTGNASAVYAGDGGAFYMYDGRICNNVAEKSGTVYILNAQFHMYGGEISGNTAVDGAGVFARKNAVLTISGGKISNNRGSGYGGGIYLNAISLQMTGGEISGNTADKNGGGVILFSGAQVEMSGGKISGNTAAVGGGTVVNGNKTVFTMNGGEISGNTAKNGGAVLTQTGALFLMKDGTIANNTASGAGGGVYVSFTSSFRMEGGKLTGNQTTKEGGGVYALGGTALLNGGSISNNHAKNAGGGIYAAGYVKKATETTEEQTFVADIKLQGTSVSGNTAGNNGGGLATGRLTKITMSGGTVSNNYAAKSAGGVYAAGADLTLSGTSVLNNEAGENGGGIATTRIKYTDNGVSKYATTRIVMTAGTVAENKAKNGGGILLQSQSTMIMKGGLVSENRADTDGAGIYVSATAAFEMTGGKVSQNKAARDGGGIFHFQSEGIYSGGTIRENTAVRNAGGLMLSRDSKMTMKDGCLMEGNSARHGGGMVLQSRSVFNMEGGEFKGNKTVHGDGGAIYLSSSTFMNMHGGRLAENEAKNNGGAIYSDPNTLLTTTAGEVVGNRAFFGGGICVSGSTQISGLNVRDNRADTNGGGIAANRMWTVTAKDDPVMRVENSLIENNMAAANGGGLYLSRGADSWLKGLTVQNNTAMMQGSGIWGVDNLSMYDMTVTGNTSRGDGYAVYLADSEYDGESYLIGVHLIGGQMQIKDNTGGNMYIGNRTAVSVDHMGLSEPTEMHIQLHSGLLTQTLFGAYDYTGADKSYIVTAGDRSVTDPEYAENYDALLNPEQEETTEATELSTEPSTEPQEQPASGGNGILYVVLGAFGVLAAALVVVLLLVRKKRSQKGQ